MQTCLAGTGSGGSAPSTFDPLTIPWYVAWRAQDALDTVHGSPTDGSVVTGVSDASGNSRPATVVDAGHAPTYRATGLNGHPALDSSTGTQSRVFTTWTALNSPFTMCVVAKMPTPAAFKAVAGNGTTANAILLGTATSNAWRQYAGTGFTNGTADAGIHLLIAEFNGSNSTFTVDGTSITGNPGVNTTLDGFTLGSGAAGSSNGSWFIGFGAVINRILTGTERTNLRSWAQAFYGTP